jgi:hypothetical protein
MLTNRVSKDVISPKPFGIKHNIIDFEYIIVLIEGIIKYLIK